MSIVRQKQVVTSVLKTSVESLEARVMFSIIPAAEQAAGALSAAVTPTAPLTTGITGEYYSVTPTADLQDALTPRIVRDDNNINFIWPTDRPDTTFAKGQFAVKWTGFITAPTTGTYTFYTNSDSGNTDLTVAGASLIAVVTPGLVTRAVAGRSSIVSLTSTAITLTAGQKVPISLSYTSGTRAAKVQLLWSGPRIKKQIVPARVLSLDSTAALPAEALTGTYYRGLAFNQEVMTRADTYIDFNWGKSSPDKVINPGSQFSVQWNGNITAPTTGSYIFQTFSDDGVKLFINGQEIINDFHDHPAKTNAARISLVAGQIYNLELQYYEHHDFALVELLWTPPGQQRTLVPFTLPPVPLAPTTVTATAASSSSINLTWNDVANETGFIVERSSNGGASFAQIGSTGQGVTTFSDTNLSPNTPYEYEIIAIDANGQSPASTPTTGSTLIAAPTNLTAVVVTPTQINLAWNDVPGETGFIIQDSANGTTGWNSIATTAAGVTTFNATGLTPSSGYFFRVIAVGSNGDSGPSNVASAATTAPNPTFATLTTLYGLTGAGTVYSINTTTGAAAQIGTLSYGTNAAGRDPFSSNLYYVSADTANVSLSYWNPNDNTNTLVAASIHLSGAVAQAAFRADGALGVTTDTGDLYGINVDTGIATLVGNLHLSGATLDMNNGDMAFAPNGDLYIETSSQLYVVTEAQIAAGTGSGSVLNLRTFGPTFSQNLQLAFGQNGVLYGSDLNGQLYTVNTTTGAATAVGTATDVNYGDLASVPLYSQLSVTQTASAFAVGGTGTYTLTVNNAGPDTNVGTIALIDTLPAGVTFASGTGTGWTFSVTGQTVTMTYNANLAAGAAAPAVTINVAIGSGVPASVTNTVTVISEIFQTTASSSSVLNTPVSG